MSPRLHSHSCKWCLTTVLNEQGCIHLSSQLGRLFTHVTQLKFLRTTGVTGNIKVGRRVHVTAGSVVLKPIKEGALVAGSPAQEVSCLSDDYRLWVET